MHEHLLLVAVILSNALTWLVGYICGRDRGPWTQEKANHED